MTLMRQLVVVVAALFVLLFAGTILITVHDTRAYLNAQLRTISQDSATSLGMSLSPALAEHDMALAESLVNAVYDSGYYRKVAVRGIDGKALVERVAAAEVEGVPGWFMRSLPLETPRGEALVMAGWQQAGTVQVAASPAQAYRTLWQHCVNAFWWFFGALVATVILAMGALHVLLRPLGRVREQALAICDREYTVQEKLPRTLELRSVVEAMNRMSGKLKEMFEEQGRAIERLRTESYQDRLTGLANRRFLEMRLAQMTGEGEETPPGALLLIELKDFKALNEQRGYQAGDEALLAAGQVIADACRESALPETLAARLSGAGFAVVLGSISGDEAARFAHSLAATLGGLYGRGLYPAEAVCHVGVALYSGHQVERLLADADMALRAAQGKGANAVHLHAPDAGGTRAILPASRWTELLRETIAERRFELHVQPVLGAADPTTVLQYEIFLRIPAAGGRLAVAGEFLPMARRAGLAPEIDRMVCGAVLARIAAGRFGDAMVAVNLSPSSVQDEAFCDWLCAALQADPAAAARIAFEVPEAGALENLPALRALVLRVRTLGGRFGIDHFGCAFASYGYLSSLKLDYLKIDGSFARGVADSRDNRFLIDSVTQVAHGLDLQVIAETVESATEWQVLSALRVDGVQGYGVAAALPEQEALVALRQVQALRAVRLDGVRGRD